MHAPIHSKYESCSGPAGGATRTTVYNGVPLHMNQRRRQVRRQRHGIMRRNDSFKFVSLSEVSRRVHDVHLRRFSVAVRAIDGFFSLTFSNVFPFVFV